jgi:hypothetical protein
MSQKLKITLAIFILLSTTLSFIILLAPKSTQKIINTWFESGQEQTVRSESHERQEIKILGPASSGSDLGQEGRR